MSDFHFIRPLWLLSIIPSVAIMVLHLRRKDPKRMWRHVVAEHLIPYMISDPSGQKGLRPHGLLGFVLVLISLALAGPAWIHEPSPFADDTAALVIALEVSPTMMAEDIQPSRIERAAQKIKDLLELRKGSKTGLVAYSGTAHLVMPLTDDAELLAGFAAELSSDIMPVEGDAPDKAILLAQNQLKSAGVAGSILLITDGVPPETLELIGKNSGNGARVHVYGVGAGPDAVVPSGSSPAPPIDEGNIKKAADAGQGSAVMITANDSDVKQIARIVETKFSASVNPDGGDRWLDFGYWLVPLIAMFTLWWFRSGWVIPFDQAGRMGLVLAISLSLLSFGRPAMANEDIQAPKKESLFIRAMDTPLMKPFFSPDQRAQFLYNAGVFDKAAMLFTDPARQGTAWYRAGDFERSAASFGRTTTPEGAFNRGNALVMLGSYNEAMESYEAALKDRPDWKEAEDNLALAKARLKNKKGPENREDTGTHYTPDDIAFDNKGNNQDGDKSEDGTGDEGQMGDAALRAMWLRQMETKPSDFLRSKFAYQHAMQEEQPSK